MANTFVSLRRLQRFYDGLKNKFALKSDIKTPDWNAQAITDETSGETTYEDGYIENKPAIKAGDGEDAVLIGQIKQKDSAAIYNITFDYPTASTDTVTFTTEDDLSGIGDLQEAVCRLVYTQTSKSSTEVVLDVYYNVTSIDLTNSTITFHKKLSYKTGLTYSSVEGTIYYKSKLARYQSVAEGSGTYAVGRYAHAEGDRTKAVGYFCHSEGSLTTASLLEDHAEGYKTEASGGASHAEGSDTFATGSCSHAEGLHTTASGGRSHAEGVYSVASGKNSHVEGYHTSANHSAQHVFGEYNIEDPSTAAATTRGNYVEIVGNGTAEDARSNAHTLDWSGNSWYAGTVSAGTIASPAPVTNNNDLTTKAYVDNAVTSLNFCTESEIDEMLAAIGVVVDVVEEPVEETGGEQ